MSQASERPGTTSLPVDTAVVARSVLAQGGACRIADAMGVVTVAAVDGLTPEALAQTAVAAAGEARLVVTGPRARTLGLAVPPMAIVALALPGDVGAAALAALADLSNGSGQAALEQGVRVLPAREAERAAIELAKQAGLLPMVLALPDGGVGVTVAASTVFAQRGRELAALQPVVETRLPIAAAEDTRLVLFRSPGGGGDQLALLVGRPETVAAPLVRLHSECLTGDLFASLRCDCGPQLQTALAAMAAAGSGVLLYLRQEGRGIGLVNKLRAYRLQDEGLDTLDANTHLGFEPDERDFAVAAAMLARLGIRRLRLLTNNPVKLEALARHGIDVVERVPLIIPATCHNSAYLATKADRSGHLLQLLNSPRPASFAAAGECRP